MKLKSILSSLTILFLAQCVFAQDKMIQLEDIWASRTFSPERVWGINSMNDGVHYSSLNYGENNVYITQYSYETGDSISTIVDSKDLDGISFSDYSFSEDEKKVLLPTETESIYRYSTRSNYFVYDRETKIAEELSEGKQCLAQFSPDASKVAFVKENNIFIKDIINNTELQVTFDGEINKIINGATDWVYEEEFAFDNGMQWNTSGNKIAYYRFDEEKVPEFSMDLFTDLYPSQSQFKYPKAGETNSTIELFIYDLDSNKTTKANINTEEEFYIPRIKWTLDENVLSVQRMNRHQNQLDFILVDAKDGSSQTIFTENDAAYIDVTDNLTFLNDGKYFIWTSEKSGYNHIYLYNLKGKQVRQITKGNYDVTDFYGIDESNNTVYFASSERSPMHRDVYAVQLNGKNKKTLTNKTGTNSATFSTNYKYFINQYSNANSPYYFSLFDAKGNEVRMLKDNSNLNNSLAQYALSQKEFFNFKTTEGIDLNGWMMKPHNFDETKQYPVFMYLYGGPGSQQVTDSWGGSNFLWYQMLTQQGYIVACVDNRGTGARGAEFKKCTYQQLGKLETEDQIQANRYLANLPYVDGSRIGIFGWSYGGYMSSLCLLKGADEFKMAIAVAPVTNWRYYDSIYTERYMRTPQENASGYDDNSPINHVEKLKGKYLLVHGSADDNVHYQNTMEMTNALVNANKQFDLFIYPNKNHGIYGGYTRLHLFTKMTNFIKENL
ncbi:MAG: S9 family peptidase [Bacteroidetes bacterium MED-G21]|nr:MAG: S9 family peptidase [Bacteroidetes bacterium MED-G21]